MVRSADRGCLRLAGRDFYHRYHLLSDQDLESPGHPRPGSVFWNKKIALRQSQILGVPICSARALYQPKMSNLIESGKCCATLVATLPRSNLVMAVRCDAPITRKSIPMVAARSTIVAAASWLTA